jgi:hypothetical protein
MDNTPYTYLFIRLDLEPARQIVQAAHAALEAGHAFGEHSHLVLIGANSEQQLLNIAEHLTTHQIEFQMFHEPDYNTGHTAICTRPLTGDERKPLRKFSLMK